MRFLAVFAVMVLVMASGMLSATVVTTTVHSRVSHATSICDGSSHSYWELNNGSPPPFCTKPPTVTCTNTYCTPNCVDTIRIDAPTTGAFTAPDASSVNYFYLDPIGQFNNCNTGGCFQNRNAPRATWTPLVYWYNQNLGCLNWAFASDPRMKMNPGLNMMVGMPAASYNGIPGGFYFPDTQGGLAGTIGYREFTSSSQANLLNMPIYDLGIGSATSGSWGIGTNNYSSMPQTFFYQPAGSTSFTKQQVPFSTNRGSITGTSFYNPGLTTTMFNVTVPSASKPK